MTIVEYLYIDEKRVNSYFEQISSPVAYDKVPTWKAGLSITSLGVEGTQNRFARPFTVSEKITSIIEYLQENDLLIDDEFSGLNKGEFHNTSLKAVQVFIPPEPELAEYSSGITLWLGYPSGKLFLCLLEDFQEDDKPTTFTKAFSVYSRLYMLATSLKAIEKKVNKTVTGKAFNNLKLTRDGKVDWWDVINWGNKNCNYDPALFLSKMGAKFGVERSVNCLYRIRDVAVRQGAFAYPIFIAAEDDV